MTLLDENDDPQIVQYFEKYKQCQSRADTRGMDKWAAKARERRNALMRDTYGLREAAE